jgi:hypothetical protein
MTEKFSETARYTFFNAKKFLSCDHQNRKEYRKVWICKECGLVFDKPFTISYLLIGFNMILILELFSLMEIFL